MKEILQVPSEGWVLHGIANIPAKPRVCKAGRRVGVVLFFDGAGSKMGTHSFYRKVADALEEAGYFALRCDNRGLCDSPGLNDLTFEVRLADAMSQIKHFRARFELDYLVSWGLCVGAAIALHSAARARAKNPAAEPDALVLNNILGDPTIVSTPELGFGRADFGRIATDMFLMGNLLTKLVNAPKKLHIYRQNFPKMAKALYARYVKRVPEMDAFRVAISEVPGLLQRWDKPHLLVYGEDDHYRTAFLQRVNPGDKLGLGKKRVVPQWATVKNGNHTFAGAQQARDAIQFTLLWLDAILDGRDPGPAFSFAEREHVVPTSPAAQ
jgi:pimeloyl-ACP methyl ester carboxylesterase